MKRNSKKLIIMFAIVCAVLPLSAEIKVGFTGMLDADISTDFKGAYNTSQEFDLGMNLDFGSGVSVGFFATAVQGRVPAAGTDATNRWPAFAFDGITVTLKDKLGKGTTVEIMDLVIQYGMMDSYYFYKRLSLITPETFLRGASFAKDIGSMIYKIVLGADASEKVIASGALKISKLNVMATYYEQSFTHATDGLIGLLSLGAVVDGLPAGIKLTAGFLAPVVDGTPEFGDAAINLSASFSIPLTKKASLAGYVLFTRDDYGINENVLNLNKSGVSMGAFEQFLAYVEPGIKLSEYFAVGLPLEYHKWDGLDDKQIWVVPTLYFYPVSGVEIWLWGQAVIHSTSGMDPDYYAGLETIVKF